MTVPAQPSSAEGILKNGWSFTDEGEGVTIVALHGMPGSVNDFRWLASALAEHAPNVRFLRVDMPGFGQTSVDAGPSPEDVAERLIDFIDAHADSEPVVLLSHSFGSIYAAELAARYPTRVSGLIFVAPVGLSMHRGYRRLPPIRLMKAGAMIPGVQKGFIKSVTRGLEKFGFRNVSESDARRVIECLNNWSWDRHTENAALISHPALCVWCEDDPLIEPEIVQKFAQTLNAQTLSFPTGGHNPQKAQAIEIAKRLHTWLDEVE